MKKSIISISFLLIVLQTVISQGYPGIYPLDDSFTRGLLRRGFNVPNEVITFGVYWNDMANTYLEINYHRNRLNTISNINYNTRSPETLIADYHSRIRDIDQQIRQITETNKARIDRDVRFIGESLAQIAAQNNLTTGDENADWLIKEVLISASQENQKRKYEAQMRQVEYQAKLDLERSLEAKMNPIKESVLQENETLKDNYLKAAAFEVNPDKERYFFDCYKFHDCFIKSVNKNYSYYNTNWLSPDCNKPGVFYNSTLTKQDYISIAYRKKELFEKYGDKSFLDATNMFLEAGLSENNKEPMAYLLKSELEDDIIKQKFYVELAYNLDKNNQKINSAYYRINKRFTIEFFSAIRKGNMSFVERSIKNKFQLGQTYSGKTPIEFAIDYDQPAVFRKLIYALPDYKSFMDLRGYTLLFHAAAVDAHKCVRTLKSMQVPLDYVDKNDRGLTALNIAIKNNNVKTAGYLIEAYKDIRPCIKYAAQSNKEDLNKFALFLYDNSTDYITEINRFYPGFKANNYSKVEIFTTPSDARIYVDGKYIGQGKVQIDELELNQNHSLEIRKSGLQTEKREIAPKKGYFTQIIVTLQETPEKELPQKSRYSDGYYFKTWKDYYTEPTTLKKEKKRNKEFNDAQRKVARDVAKKAANDYNETVKGKLYAVNQTINQKNKQIRARNKELEFCREFKVIYAPSINNRVVAQNTSSKHVKINQAKNAISKVRSVQVSYNDSYEVTRVKNNNLKNYSGTLKNTNIPETNHSKFNQPSAEVVQTIREEMPGYIGTVTQQTGNIIYMEIANGSKVSPGSIVKIYSSSSGGNELIANGYVSFVNKGKCTIELQLVDKKVFAGDLVRVK